MIKLKQVSLGLFACVSMSAWADFSFDRPGEGFGTGITGVGQLAWEQSLPSATYSEGNEAGFKNKRATLNADMLLRTGIAKNTELQLGWDGPGWSKERFQNRISEDHGLGDVSIGVKHRVDLNDERLSMAVLARAVIATGNRGFSNEDDIYTLASSVNYHYDENVTTGISMYYSVQNGDWSVTAVPTIGYKIFGKLSGFSELVYTKKEGVDNQYGLGSGLIYAVNNRTQLDATLGVDLEGSQRSYKGGLGLAYLF